MIRNEKNLDKINYFKGKLYKERLGSYGLVSITSVSQRFNSRSDFTASILEKLYSVLATGKFERVTSSTNIEIRLVQMSQGGVRTPVAVRNSYGTQILEILEDATESEIRKSLVTLNHPLMAN